MAITATVAHPRRSLARRFLHSEHVAGWAFIAPAVFLIALFGLVPIVWTGVISFQANDLISKPHWVGLANYKALFKDPVFRSSVGHTILYTALFVPISVGGALAIAVALNRRIRGIRFYRLAVFVPVVTSTVATGIVFLWLMDPTFGLFNYLLHAVGLPQQHFLQDPNQALYCIVVITVWGWLGFDVIIYLAALQGIPQELLDASAIDGATRWGTFRSIVLPLLGPATLFLVVWSTINALQLFDEIYVTTKGGPLGSTTVIVYYLYQQAFQYFNAGYGAAIAYVLLAGILVLTLVQLWIGSRRVFYQVEGMTTELITDTAAVRLAPLPEPRRRRLPFSGWHLVLMPLAAVMLLPLVWMVIISLETKQEAQQYPPVLIPKSLQFHNYVAAFNAVPFAHFFVNSLLYSLVTVAGNLLFCSLAAYAFARIRFFASKVVFVLLLITLMVPFQVLIIPTFLIVKHLGLVDSVGGLIVPNLCTAFGIFLLRQFFSTLPIELEEAARIDGTSRLGVLFKIVLPLSLPALATLAIIQFMWSWNDFLWPLIIINSDTHAPLQLGLSMFQGAHSTEWNLLMAATVMSQLPMLLIFLFAQRWFVRSIAFSGMTQ